MRAVLIAVAALLAVPALATEAMLRSLVAAIRNGPFPDDQLTVLQ